MADERDNPDTVAVLNDYRGVETHARTRKSGKINTTLAIRSEPIYVCLDEKEIGRAASDAIVEVLREQISKIQITASPATLKKRESQAKAFASGDHTALKEFSGGRMGPMSPNKTDRLFNNSGRLAAGITGNYSQQQNAWIIRFPTNRFSPEFLLRRGAQGILDRLVDLIPALRAPAAEPKVREAIEKSTRKMITKIEGQIVEAGRRGDQQIAAGVVRVLQGFAKILG